MNDAPLFGAGDVAGILGETEATVRRWHHAGGFSRFFGVKNDYAVRYSARDIAGICVARELLAIGFPPPLAARIGATVTYRDPDPAALVEGTPFDIATIAPPPGSGIVQDRVVWRMPAKTASKISIPVGQLFKDVTEKARGLRLARAA